jgi:hypothetical protein
MPEGHGTNSQQELTPPTQNEISQIIRNLKTNKAAGPDNMVLESIKNGDRALKMKLHELVSKIWKEEQVPTQWNEGIICTIFKKRDRLNCNNYRPIMLLNVAYKILAILLNKRLIEIVEHKLGEQQAGFRPDSSTIDNIHSEANL